MLKYIMKYCGKKVYCIFHYQLIALSQNRDEAVIQ